MDWNFGFNGERTSGFRGLMETLLDTDLTGLTANSIIIYNPTTGQWENAESIASWAISTVAFYLDGATAAQSAGMASADYPFYAGAFFADRATAPFRVTNAGLLSATGATISGDITATSGAIGGWNLTATDLYNLISGTPSSSPNDGVVISSADQLITLYEDTEARVRLGMLSSGVYGLQILNDDGTEVLFEISDTQQIFAGWDIAVDHISNTRDGNTTEISSDDITFLSGPTGSPTFTITRAGLINAVAGMIGGWGLSSSSLSSTSSGNTTTISAGDTSFSAGPTGAPTFSVTRAGVLSAVNAILSGSITATGGQIGGWYVDSNLLRSSAVGSARVELDKANSRISVKDSTDAYKVVMGYLNGLWKHDMSGTWGAGDYGFWAAAGDKLVIDGDTEYKSGDWIVENDGSLLIKDSAGNVIIRLGTDSGNKGLFLYNASGDKFVSLTKTGIALLSPGSGQYYGTGIYYGTGYTYGSGARAYIHNTGKNVPFYCNSSSAYGDFHYKDRSADPTGAAEVGDTVVVNGVHKVCTVAGTPGTWTVTGTQS